MNSVARLTEDEPSLLAAGLARLKDPRQCWPALICFSILAAAAFSGPVDIAEGAGGELDLRLARTPSLVFKLATALSAGVVGAWGLTCIPQARRVLLTIPGMLLCAVAALFLLTCATSITSASIPIALVFVAYLLFMPTCLTILNLRGSLFAVLCGVAVFTFGALLLYVFAPRFGVYPEDFGKGVVVERLGGMSQPNHTGRSAMIGLLISSYFFRLPRSPKLLCLSLMGVFLLAGVLAMSRTALLAGGICLVILNLDLLLTRAGLSLACLGLLAGVGIVFALAATGREEVIVEKLLGTLTKTGEIEEFTSVTGRAEIWERAILLIKGRPLQGYGMGSAKVMLVDHLQSTHNILLHPTLAAGVGAGALTLVLLLWNLINVFMSPQLIVRALCAYLLISGVTEDTIYETFPGPCTLLWIACCLWPASFLAPARNSRRLAALAETEEPRPF